MTNKEKLEALTELAREVIIHFNLGTLEGQPKALIALGNMSVFIHDEIDGGER